MATLVDTNLLLRAAQQGQPSHQQAADAVAGLLLTGEDLYLTRQNLVEFWVAATRSVEGNGRGMSATDAESELDRLEEQFPVLADTDNVYAEWARLVRRYGVTGYRAYDARLVASMITYGIDTILTFNDRDFRLYDEVTVLHPRDVSGGTEPLA